MNNYETIDQLLPEMNVESHFTGSDAGINLNSYEAPSVSAIHRKKAFTLVELMTVVGITGILIGVLLPAIGAARGRAQTLQGQTNQRGIVQGINVYSNDNQGRIPLTVPWATHPGGVTTNVQDSLEGVHGLGTPVGEYYGLELLFDPNANFYNKSHIESGWQQAGASVHGPELYRCLDPAVDVNIPPNTGDERIPNHIDNVAGLAMLVDSNLQKNVGRYVPRHGDSVVITKGDGVSLVVKDPDHFHSTGGGFPSGGESMRYVLRWADEKLSSQ